ncbi:hypothetical protein GCM10009678_93600 [Actinomadura kijaniata]
MIRRHQTLKVTANRRTGLGRSYGAQRPAFLLTRWGVARAQQLCQTGRAGRAGRPRGRS